MKHIYSAPELELKVFDLADILTMSGPFNDPLGEGDGALDTLD